MVVDFPDALVALVTGRDAERYLNARLSNNIKMLLDGEWIDAAALTPQGKIEAIFQIKRLSKEEYLLISDGGEHGELIAALKRYIVADRVALTDLSEKYRLIHLPHESNSSIEAFAERPRQRTGVNGTDVLLSKDAWQTLLAKTQTEIMPRADYDVLRLTSGILAFPDELRAISISEIDYHALVSFKKGCYVGQELVEKVDSFASAPKMLARILIRGQHRVTPGTEVLVDNHTVGKVVTCATSQNYAYSICVARIKNDQTLAAKTARLAELSGTITLRQTEQLNVE